MSHAYYRALANNARGWEKLCRGSRRIAITASIAFAILGPLLVIAAIMAGRWIPVATGILLTATAAVWVVAARNYATAAANWEDTAATYDRLASRETPDA